MQTPSANCWGSIAYTAMNNPSTGTVPAGSSGEFKVAWSAQDLYVLAYVQSWPLYNAGATAFKDDNVEFYVAGDDTKLSGAYGPADCHYNVPYTDAESAGAGCQITGPVTAVTKTVQGVGYYDELIVPWSTLRVSAPAKGQQYSFTIAYDIPNSSGTRLGQDEWAGGANNNASETLDWGTITLQ